MVKNFIPDNSRVSSFYLPLYCESCDEEGSALLETGKDVVLEGEGISIKADISECIYCGEKDVEPDIIEKKYFRFMQK